MPRKARELSESNIYHIMMRAINRQQIFEDAEDNEKFIEILIQYKEICKYEIYAFCLMGNHLHLLMKFKDESPEIAFRRINSKFVYWYNTKYQRVGHLFQDRFKSEPVNDVKYLLGAIRYIHNNPVKAGMCENPEDYKYSSYNNYLSGSDFIDTDFIFSIIPIEKFVEFHKLADQVEYLEASEKCNVRVTDEEAKKAIKSISGCKTASEFQALNIEKREEYIRKLREKGLSIRQLSRLTGLPIAIIR